MLRKEKLTSKLIITTIFTMLITSGTVAATLTSSTISDQIEDQLIYDPAVKANNINIITTDGIVTLTGITNNILAKERAERIAETVKGVRSVINKITVEPTDMRNQIEIESDVNEALLKDPATNSFDIDVDVQKGGKVVLTGTVDSMQEKMLAGQVAKGVRGVVSLNNSINVEYDVERSESDIKADIEEALRNSVLIDNSLIDVTVNDDQVVLEGTVGSASEKRKAMLKSWVAGVRDVEADDLDVERWARDDVLRENKYVDKSDSSIEEAVEDALLYDPRVKSYNVEVNVMNGQVTLRGNVSNLKAKRSAKNDAENTVGVINVTNRLKVKPEEERSSEEIADNIENALLRDPYTERFEITVNVVDNTAYLYGTVDSHFEKGQAEDIASRVEGVTMVQNNIDVEEEDQPYIYNPYVSYWNTYDYDWYDYEPGYTFETDSQILADVKDEIWWSPFVDSEDVNVTVEDGTVTLTGNVDTWAEFRAAQENAYEGGATWVDNNLDVG